VVEIISSAVSRMIITHKRLTCSTRCS
jgi:hypothetical protein